MSGLRVLHVITTLDVGGAEVHLLSQVRGQAARGLAPEVRWLKGEGRLREEFLAAGATSAERSGPLALARAMRRADLVHTHLLKADMLGALLALATGTRRRLVASKHNDERSLLRPAVSRIHGLLGGVARRTVILSAHVVEYFARHGRLARERMRLVYYGIDPAPFEAAVARVVDAGPAERARRRSELGLAADDLVYTCVARFAPQKRHDLLLAAFARARVEVAAAGGPNLRLLLVGGDPFGDGQARAEAAARDLALGDAVLFLGIRRDVPDLYALSDAFVMSSQWEGLGLVFLEAMAAGLPVVATGVSAVPEVVADGETGLLASFGPEPEGDPAPLAAAFARLALDPALRARLGAAGPARVRERFGLDRMVDETLAVYAEVLGHDPLPTGAGSRP